MVGTPGRLSELLKAGDLLLDQCQAVVLDEVDILLGDTGMFQEQACHRVPNPSNIQIIATATAHLPFKCAQMLTLLKLL